MSYIGFIGGTGSLGTSLAIRLAMARHDVIIGSRNPQHAISSASMLSTLDSKACIKGASNADVAAQANIIFVTIPYKAQVQILGELQDSLAGKTVVSTVNHLVFHKGLAQIESVPSGSAALETQTILPSSNVVAGFQTVSYLSLKKLELELDLDVILCSDHDVAKKEVMNLAESIRGIRAINGGVLANSAYVESLTALLLNINKIYKCDSSVKITGM